MAVEDAEISAQQSVLSSLLSSLTSNSTASHLLTGKSGVGKTWVASQIRKKLELSEGWKVIYLPCPQWAEHQPLSPFDIGLSQIAPSGVAETGARFATTAARDIPFVGNTTSAALAGLLDMKRDKHQDLSSRLPRTALDICAKLQKKIGDEKCLLILDDSQWLDVGSKDLLSAFSEPNLKRTFKFLAKTHLLALMTPEQSEKPIGEIAVSLGISKFNTYSIAECSEAEFLACLRAFGLEEKLNDELGRSLFSIVGGHLKIVKHLADLLSSDFSFDELDIVTPKKILQIAIESKLSSLGVVGAKLRELLSKAVAIGSDFTVNELSCLVGLDISSVQRKLDEAERALLVSRTGQHVAFSHTVIREFFEEDPTSATTKSDHGKFAECLKLMRPGLYGLRAAHLAQAGFAQEAVVLSICEAASRYRSGINSPWNGAIQSAQTSAPDLLSVIEFLKNSYDSFEIGNYRRVSELCEGLVATAPAFLSVEAAILQGRALIKSSNDDNEKKRAATVLRAALADIEEDEAELWGRASLYLAVAEAYAGNLDAAKAVVKRMSRSFEKRLNYDPTAQTLLNKLRLRADMFFSEEIAAAELEKARHDLLPSDEEPSNPTLAYIALCNLSGNSLYRGYFQEALAQSATADAILKSFNSLSFPRMDILGNNQLLSAWLSKKITDETFCKSARKLVEASPDTNDKGILYNNLAVGLALSGELEEAVEILQSQYQKFSLPSNSDYYDRYFLGNNFAGCLFELGHETRAQEVWDSLSQLPELLPYPIRGFMCLRHSVQGTIFENAKHRDVKWDNFACEMLRERIGTMWKFFGRGFILSELQFWSDD